MNCMKGLIKLMLGRWLIWLIRKKKLAIYPKLESKQGWMRLNHLLNSKQLRSTPTTWQYKQSMNWTNNVTVCQRVCLHSLPLPPLNTYGQWKLTCTKCIIRWIWTPDTEYQRRNLKLKVPTNTNTALSTRDWLNNTKYSKIKQAIQINTLMRCWRTPIESGQTCTQIRSKVAHRRLNLMDSSSLRWIFRSQWLIN